jgi:ABC-type polysaccharide/polyol phosphate export permease
MADRQVMQWVRDAKEMLREQVEYRYLLWQMTRRDLLLRYKQTVMGIGWAVFMPILNTAVFSVIFMRVAPLDVGMPYPLFAYSGLVAWNFTASTLRFSVLSLTSNLNLVTKVYFPREAFPFSALLVSLVDTAVAGCVLLGLMAYYGVWPGPTALYLPLVALPHVLLTAALGLLLSMGNLFYRDVKYLFEAGIAIGMFVTSVVYPAQLVGGRLGALLQLNPMTPIIEAYRDVLLRQTPPAPSFWLAASVSIVAFFGAWLLFHRSEYEFAENI